MNSLLDKDGKQAGLYLHIKDSEFSVKMFTKFYNLATQNHVLGIDSKTAKDLIHTGKYHKGKSNQIYVDDPNSDKNILKSINTGDYMVFMHGIKKLYIFNKVEFKKFMLNNEYTRDKAITYILGIDNGVEFKNMHMITANTLNNAKHIYTTRYKCEEPICLGIVENDHLNILSDKHKFTVPLVM